MGLRLAPRVRRLDGDIVAPSQRTIKLFKVLGAARVCPFPLNGWADCIERRQSSLRAPVDKYEVQAVARRNGSLPAAHRHTKDPLGKIFAEGPNRVALEHRAKTVAKQKGVAEADLSVLLARQLCADFLGALLQRLPARRTEEHMAECHGVFVSELVLVRSEIGIEFAIGRFGCRSVFGQELHFLPDAAADDDVVPVESECLAFAVVDLVADGVLNEAC